MLVVVVIYAKFLLSILETVLSIVAFTRALVS